MPERSSTHLLLIPSYNTGGKLVETVRDALKFWAPVWVVVDGSTDGSDAAVEAILPEYGGDLRLLRLKKNSGKGTAVLHGVTQALEEGFTHVLTMDADGQHASGYITTFMQASRKNPNALVLGLPQFDDSAPLIRLRGRRIANWWAQFESQSNLGDCLFGFRVYPARSLYEVMQKTRWARRFDFDPEVAIRLIWRGHPPLNVPAPCRYLTIAEGGISHFNYYRDNVLMTWMFARLLVGAFIRMPWLLARRFSGDHESVHIATPQVERSKSNPRPQ
ncbi:glycosyltransferase family 2 protein [Phragmitibacter flavus]|uniref:Glycosyltransferase family 2 protein n=1 Tax=Phragmitibacter flavus TaxID=2576071 RepID=A0A5R8KE66_9BACT|nr:glycosyltransferase family 2 protein [Phragmitibacter flavus]TLD70604.1 glycosyltransferase family 2 protein [Phragmitibacter flavus]